MRKKPLWTIDEWILGLETYFMLKPNEIRHDNPLIIQLSKTLRSLPIHGNARNSEIFRNVNGVVMQLYSFKAFDPNYKRDISISHSNIQNRTWNIYSQNKERLNRIALAIKNSLPLPFEFSHFADADEDDFPYGKILYQYHRYIENTSQFANNFKDMMKRRRFIECEVCGFDFHITYGRIGKDFIEVHHALDIAEYTREMKVRASDFVMVCSNCHRMLHRIPRAINKYDLKEKGVRCIITSGTQKREDTF